jgi:hypothetical protein
MLRYMYIACIVIGKAWWLIHVIGEHECLERDLGNVCLGN